MKTTKKINGEWSKYDRMVALSQLANYGVIFLDEYDLPIDDEYELEELNQTNIKTVAIFERQFNAGRKMVIMELHENKIFSVKTLCDNELEREAVAINATEANKIMLQMIEESM